MKKQFLEAMKMPAAPAKKSKAPSEDAGMAPADESELEDELFGDSDEEEAEPEAAEAGGAADLSDDELMAEAKRRGMSVSPAAKKPKKEAPPAVDEEDEAELEDMEDEDDLELS